MLELKENEKLVCEYPTYYLIERKCPEGKTYRTTKMKWQQTDFSSKSPKYDVEGRLDKMVGGMSV